MVINGSFPKNYGLNVDVWKVDGSNVDIVVASLVCTSVDVSTLLIIGMFELEEWAGCSMGMVEEWVGSASLLKRSTFSQRLPDVPKNK
jgi:hypothetical protein